MKLGEHYKLTLLNHKEGHVEGSWHRVDSTHFVDDCDDLTQVADHGDGDDNAVIYMDSTPAIIPHRPELSKAYFHKC